MEIKFYKVGGFVRDQILGTPSKDIDYAVEAPSYEAMRDYIAARGKIFQERPQFFTIRAKLNGEDCDYVLCRKEGFYTDGRRPDSVQIGTIFDDLARRDFTCNAMALDMDGKLIDPHGGLKALEKRELACVGSAIDRFSEDSLRILRAIRFSIVKGMSLDPAIQECLANPELLAKLKNVSVERIREELFKCFNYSTPATLKFFSSYRGHFVRDMIFDNFKLSLVPTIRPS